MRITSLTVVVVGLTVAACQSGPSQTASQATSATPPTVPQTQPVSHKLSADELRAMVSTPHTVYAAGTYGPKTIATYYADGHIKSRSPGGGDTGVYRVSDDGKFCTTYKTFRGGKENCQDIYQTGPNMYEAHLPDGTIVGPNPQVPGNPEGL